MNQKSDKLHKTFCCSRLWLFPLKGKRTQGLIQGLWFSSDKPLQRALKYQAFCLLSGHSLIRTVMQSIWNLSLWAATKDVHKVNLMSKQPFQKNWWVMSHYKMDPVNISHRKTFGRRVKGSDELLLSVLAIFPVRIPVKLNQLTFENNFHSRSNFSTHVFNNYSTLTFH